MNARKQRKKFWRLAVAQRVVDRAREAFVLAPFKISHGFPGATGGKEPACRRRRQKRCGFDLWVGKTPWRRAWQPTGFLPAESQGQRSPVGYSPRGHEELGTTEVTWHAKISTVLPENMILTAEEQDACPLK